ncbi:MAG: hypothetical protein C4289_06695, partial [Chloroflexota bacterium]
MNCSASTAGGSVSANSVASPSAFFFTTAPPFEYKYRALGVPLVFMLMGPLMVEGSYYTVSGAFST